MTKTATWTVYRVMTPRNGAVHPYLKEVGTVQAAHQPGALIKAFEAYPEHMDQTKTQAGFHVEKASA